MCRSWHVQYQWCGHFSQTEYLFCDRPNHCSDELRNTSRDIELNFCDSCFMLPDPRAQPNSKMPVDFERNLEPPCPGSTDHQPMPVEQILAMIPADWNPDLLEFVGPQIELRPHCIYHAIVRLALKLEELFWKSLNDTVLRVAAPPRFELRLLILKVRTWLHWNNAEQERLYQTLYRRAQERWTKEESLRGRRLGSLLTIKSLDEVPDGDQTCNICRELYAKPHQQRNLAEHSPVILHCGHLFGQNCILAWLRDHNSCPDCRTRVRAIWPETPIPAVEYSDFEEWVDACIAAAQRTIPNWLNTMYGGTLSPVPDSTHRSLDCGDVNQMLEEAFQTHYGHSSPINLAADIDDGY